MVLRPVVARRTGAIVAVFAFPRAAAREDAVAAKNDPNRQERKNEAGGENVAKCNKCNHPTYTGSFLLQPNDALGLPGMDFGIIAGVTWDGGDTCEVVEWIAYDPIPNPPFQEANGADLPENGPPYRVPHIPVYVTPGPGAGGAAEDLHRIARSGVQSPPTTGGTITVKQTYRYQCSVCNCAWTPFTPELTIEHKVYRYTGAAKATKNPGHWYRSTRKTGLGLASDEQIC